MSSPDAAPQRYELLERIAGGGMGEVFRARADGAHGFEKVLAIKRILPRYAADAKFEQRFVAEAKLAAALTHANIVQVFDFGHLAGSLYIAMEYVDGATVATMLKAYAASGRSIPLCAVMHVAIELCKGLDFAHQRGVVHRDVSPANILLSRAGEVKIADFGIARAADRTSLFRTGTIVGKWGYISPEQTLGEPVTAATDLFAVGIVLHEMLTGMRLFDGRDFDTVTTQIRSSPIPRPSRARAELPQHLDDVVLRCLERDPARRFAKANAIARALMEVCYGARLFPTPRDVADAIAVVVPDESSVVDDEPPGIDEAICAELMNAGVEAGEPTRATQVARRPEAGRRKRTTRTLTFVRNGTDLHGLAKWEIQARAARAPGPGRATSPLPIPISRRPAPALSADADSGRPRRGMAVWLAGGVILAVAAVLAWRGSAANDRVPDPPPGPQQIAVVRGVDAAVADDVPIPPPPDASIAHAPDASGSRDAAGRPEKTAKKRRKVHYGTVDIYVSPWADVYFRGHKVAEAPVQGLRLPVGKHRLTLINPVRKRKTTLVVEVPGKTRYRVRLP